MKSPPVTLAPDISMIAYPRLTTTAASSLLTAPTTGAPYATDGQVFLGTDKRAPEGQHVQTFAGPAVGQRLRV